MTGKWVAGLLLGSIATSAFAFDPVGGSGDRQDRDMCPGNEFFIGVDYWSGSWMDNIRVLCAPINPDGTKGVPVFHYSSRGGTGGGHGRGGTCPSPQIVQGIWFKLTINNQVKWIKFFCADVALKQSSDFTIGNEGPGATEKKEVVQQSCNGVSTGEAVKGLIINSGGHVNALGVVCGPMPKIAAKPVPGAPDAQEAADRDPNGKTAQQCQEAFARNKQRCDNRFVGVARADCYVTYNQILASCVTLAAQGNGGAAKVKFVAANKVYKAPSGQDTPENTVCEARAGDTADLIAKGADTGLDPHWVQLGNISGGCGGQSGWVWNDGELQLP